MVPRSGTYYQKPTASCEAPQRNHKQYGSAKRDLLSETHCKLRSTAKEPQAVWFRKAGPTIRNPLQAAKQRSCGYERQHPLPTVPRSGTDISTMILRTVHRSRFAEPRESVSVFAYPQRRSFGACSGFQIDTCPIGTRRCSYCHTITEVARLRSNTKEPQAAEQTEEVMASRRSHAPTDDQALAASGHGQADKAICGVCLLWEAAWLRRDAIASWVCIGCL